MNSSASKYSCKYYSVGYFVFLESNTPDPANKFFMEPIMEVEDEAQGLDFINWLNSNHFVAQQIANIANDNH